MFRQLRTRSVQGTLQGIAPGNRRIPVGDCGGRGLVCRRSHAALAPAVVPKLFYGSLKALRCPLGRRGCLPRRLTLCKGFTESGGSAGSCLTLMVVSSAQLLFALVPYDANLCESIEGADGV